MDLTAGDVINPVKSRVGGVDATFPSVFRRDGRHVVSQPRKSFSHYVFPPAPHLTNESTSRLQPDRRKEDGMFTFI